MQTATLCAQVARSLGEPLRLIQRRGFQLVQSPKNSVGSKLAAVDCPFCGQQVLVASPRGTIEAECLGCDTAFPASAADVYAISIEDAEPPQARLLLHASR